MRTLTNFVILVIALLLLASCSADSTLAPDIVAPADTLPACRIEVGCVPILPPPSDL